MTWDIDKQTAKSTTNILHNYKHFLRDTNDLACCHSFIFIKSKVLVEAHSFRISTYAFKMKIRIAWYLFRSTGNDLHHVQVIQKLKQREASLLFVILYHIR